MNIMQRTVNKFNIIDLEETDSTNRYLKNLLTTEHPEEFSVVRTDFQSSGRGQQGNSWNSEKGKNLLFSIVIYPSDIEANRQFIISRMISVAIYRVLSHFTDGIKIKWPNDIYFQNRKIAGILIENSLMGKNIRYSVIGVGLNINQTMFPENIPNPVSLKQITMSELDKNKILDSILMEFRELNANLKNKKTTKIKKKYLNNLFQLRYLFFDHHQLN